MDTRRPTYMELLRGGDVFVHPSRAEGVPKVLVDAMAAGLPIVATAAGAVPGVLGGGKRGVPVHEGDAGALADAVSSLLSNRASWLRLRERGLEWAADHTAEAQARRLIGQLRGLFPGLSWPG